MNAPYEIAAIRTIVDLIKDSLPPEDWDKTLLPVIAAPREWLERFAQEAGAEPGKVPSEIYFCPVVQQDELDQPWVITHDGKKYRVWSAIPKPGQQTDTALLSRLLPEELPR